MATHRRFARQAANALTVARIAAVPFFIVSLFGSGAGSGTAALALFVFAAASDYFDGLIARRLGAQSRFGEFLDPLADKILTGSAFVSFAFIPGLAVPLWLVLVILLREAALTIIRAAAIKRGAPLRTELSGKVKTAVQMTSIVIILALLLAKKTFTAPGSSADALMRLRLPFLLVAASAAAALISMASYLVKNRSVAGNWSKNLRAVVLFLSTGCFVGFTPKAGGTIATLLGSAVWVFCSRSPVYYALCGITLITAYFTAGYAEKVIFAKKDSPRIVIDEIAGILVTFLTFSFSYSPNGLLTYALGFLLFRFFDILKPAPIHILQRCKGGAGVLFDDLAAGVFANAGLQIFRYLTGLWRPGGL